MLRKRQGQEFTHLRRKRLKYTESPAEECIIHHESVKKEEKLVSIQDVESWNTLLNAAKIRNYQPIVAIAANTEENEIPNVHYHRTCRSLFTMKKSLDSLSKENSTQPLHNSESDNQERRLSSRHAPSSSRVYGAVCMFCDSSSKYVKRGNTPEILVKCVDLRADNKIRKIATEKGDNKIIAMVTRELVAAETHYHRSCYRNYTRQAESGTYEENSSGVNSSEYATLETEALEKLFSYIREDLLENPRVVRLTDLTGKLVSFLNDLGISDVRESTKKHLRRRLESNFGNLLKFGETARR